MNLKFSVLSNDKSLRSRVLPSMWKCRWYRSNLCRLAALPRVKFSQLSRVSMNLFMNSHHHKAIAKRFLPSVCRPDSKTPSSDHKSNAMLPPLATRHSLAIHIGHSLYGGVVICRAARFSSHQYFELKSHPSAFLWI